MIRPFWILLLAPLAGCAGMEYAARTTAERAATMPRDMTATGALTDLGTTFLIGLASYYVARTVRKKVANPGTPA